MLRRSNAPAPTAPAKRIRTRIVATIAGLPANTTFQYVVGIGAPTTYVLTPPKHSSSYELTVTYTY
ncbi:MULTISPECIES: hypothetical protein [Polymorphospora]|uniref:Uncharacterized protein n=1 Tax=Polymorphospora lycopeni TaxID=3140240 RepID=A0ABV5CLN8_9ACTN